MKYDLIIDFEMCNVVGKMRKKAGGMRNEIIQIGAVMLNDKHHIIDEFSAYAKPEFGHLDKFIKELTGITEEDLNSAKSLRIVLQQFMEWIGDRKARVISWSDNDYQQLKYEMRVKKIKNHKIQDLFDDWVDFQKSFDKMLHLNRQYGLEDAMKIGRVQPLGRQHNGLCDAYNTARLYAKVYKQPAFRLELEPIVEYDEKVEHLTYKIGDIFTPELLARLELLPSAEDENETEIKEESTWTLRRKLYKRIKGAEAATDENWSKYLFGIEMRKVDYRDKIKSFFMQSSSQS